MHSLQSHNSTPGVEWKLLHACINLHGEVPCDGKLAYTEYQRAMKMWYINNMGRHSAVQSNQSTSVKMKTTQRQYQKSKAGFRTELRVRSCLHRILRTDKIWYIISDRIPMWGSTSAQQLWKDTQHVYRWRKGEQETTGTVQLQRCLLYKHVSSLPPCPFPFLFKGIHWFLSFLFLPILPLRWQSQKATERGHWDGGGDRQGRSRSKQSTYRDHGSQVSHCWGKGVRTLDGVMARSSGWCWNGTESTGVNARFFLCLHRLI